MRVCLILEQRFQVVSWNELGERSKRISRSEEEQNSRTEQIEDLGRLGDQDFHLRFFVQIPGMKGII